MKKVSDIGSRIKEYRDIKDLTLSDLETLTQIPSQTLNRYELCKRVPKIDIANHIADALNVNPLWIQGYDQPMELPSYPYEDPAAAPTRASVAAKLEGFLRQAGYLNEDEPLTPELLSSISVALETAIEIYRKNHQ